MVVDAEDYSRLGEPDAHAASHESGGSDEIDVTGLTPKDHASSHENGGSDEIDVAGLAGRTEFVDRGDPAAADFALGDLTTDGNPHELDLSGIVPVGTIAVKMRVSIMDDAADSYIYFRKNGNSNLSNVDICRTYVAGIAAEYNVDVALDGDRKCEYTASNLTFNSISITVRFYWK